jgi:rubredoxin
MNIIAAIRPLGGALSPRELEEAALAAQDAPYGLLHLGPRQELLIPGVSPDHPRLRSFGPLARDAQGSPNLISSQLAGGLSGKDWAVAQDAYREIHQSLPPDLGIAVNLCHPAQAFTPLFSGRLNFIASEDPGYWFLVFRLQRQRHLFPSLIPSDLISVAISLVRKRLAADPDCSVLSLSSSLLENLPRLKTAPAFAPADAPAAPAAGFLRQDDGRFSLILDNRQQPWRWQTLQALADTARLQGLGQLYLTPQRQLLIKHLAPDTLAIWRRLCATLRLPLQGGRDATWLLPPADPDALILSQRLDSRELSGLSLAINADPECGSMVLIESQRGFFGLRRYRLSHKAGFDPRSPVIIEHASELSFSRLRQALVDLQRQFVATPARDPQPLAMPLPQAPLPQRHHCRDCRSEYLAELGSPTLGIAPGTPFNHLPADWCCPLCDAPIGSYQTN